jgi:hypothetical protein
LANKVAGSRVAEGYTGTTFQNESRGMLVLTSPQGVVAHTGGWAAQQVRPCVRTDKEGSAMEIDHRPQRAPIAGTPATHDGMTPGKRTLTESLAVPSCEPASAPDPQLTENGTAASAPSPLPISASSRSGPALQMLFGGLRAATATPVDGPAQAAAGGASVDDVAEGVARGEAIHHLLPATGSETAARAVQRRKLDNGDVVPDDLQVTWSGDPFTIRFDHRAGSPDGRFVFTLHYTGPHPVDGPFIDPTAKVVTISAGPIGAQTLAATVVRQVGTTLTVDLYGDSTMLVKLIDKPGFDPPTALNSGRRHTLGIEVNGTPRADAAGIWIKDPAASPIAASTIQDDLPGENPQSRMTITAGGVIDEMRIDGDGDQSKELLVSVSAKDDWPDPERKDVARHVTVEVKQLSSAQTRSFELELPRPTSLGSLFPLVREVTDGKAPTRISLVLPTDSQPLTIDPPTREAADVVYGAHALGKSFPLRFPAEAKGTLPIAGANTPAPIIGGISSVDLRLGYYGDQFRVTVQPTGSDRRCSASRPSPAASRSAAPAPRSS